MPSFPPPGSVTVCEINRDLITAECLSDNQARDSYGKVLGIIFSPVPFQCDSLLSPEHGGEQQGRVAEGVPRNKGLWALQEMLSNSLKRLFHPNDVNLLPEVDLQAVSWHQHKHILAFISEPNQVIVRDFEDSEAKDPCILTNESQRDVKLLEWRPNGGRTISVACKGGICIWAASYPGQAVSVRSGIASFLGTFSRGSSMRWTMVDFLQSHNDEQITALSWSPDGRYPKSLFYIAVYMFDYTVMIIFMRKEKMTYSVIVMSCVTALAFHQCSFFSCPFSDAYGRLPVKALYISLVIYIRCLVVVFFNFIMN